jgi:hypothetical protein
MGRARAGGARVRRDRRRLAGRGSLRGAGGAPVLRDVRELATACRGPDVRDGRPLGGDGRGRRDTGRLGLHGGQVALALTCGIVALLAGLLRLGFVASFISEPVLKGFILTLLFLTSFFESLPEATLAAVVISAVIELVDYRGLVRL